MLRRTDFYIDGAWVAPSGQERIPVCDPAVEEVVGVVSQGTPDDVDRAVAAARQAFRTYGLSDKQDRIALMRRIIDVYSARTEEIARTISMEMGAPITFAREAQTASLIGQFEQAIDTLRHYEFERPMDGSTMVRREPIGVCGLITAWNWPLNLIASKLAYALAAGCTVVLKPSEVAPLSAMLLADVMHDAGVPAGVFNLVNGDGATVGQSISAHPDIDMISFTGSTRAGVLIAKAAADSVKRVHQELGGKSANIILPDVDLQAAVHANVRRSFLNSGQSCQAPTRMLVHRSRHEEALGHAKAAAESIAYGDPAAEETVMGPVVSEIQYERVQSMIRSGLAQGARLVCGGLGRPDGLERGFFVRPTIFGDVGNHMTIAREEIFGPVLPVIPYDTEDEAVDIANDTPYGLANYIQSGDGARARRLAARLRSGRVYINTMGQNSQAPFGGYKQSGNGREGGEFGLEEYLEVKAIIGS
ncbi:aldehyde dehydrogenase [Acrocarpospora pleiomorpha]|uniref:Aldehyde dehydrogenase n=1 Tax=Acrocarpospora pleiomorpha TaxID=90975 RepID=A0A5M3XW06_9ACTN|nr:aldehyde dehydrogenase family protein [Acrocarpospora pleiomorpha]GES24239.1 aldehyde dehydrogenase [Acrocarpospora pleiomorpha]